MTGVGFGASGPANKPQDVGFHDDKIAGENTIDSIGGLISEGMPSVLYADFDHPTNNECNIMGSSTPCAHEFMITGGDSGGGMFFKEGKEWKLAGISSGTSIDIQRLTTTGYYGQTMAWTNVPAFLKWLDESGYRPKK